MIWVVGKNGMLGREILGVFDKNNIEYFATGSDIDIRNLDLLKDFIADKNIKTIINCSAYTKVDLAEDEVDLCYSVNSLGVSNLVEVAKSIDANFIHFSTDYVFDGKSKTPYKEDSKTSPINIYGRSKLKGEEYSKEYSKSMIIRVSWLYGVFGKNFVATMINLMNTKDSIKVVNDQLGSPTHTLDVANFIYDIICNDNIKYGIYHYSNDGNISWYDFALSIYELGVKFGFINNKCIINPCSSLEYPTKAKRAEYTVFSLEKIKNIFNIKIPNYKDSLTKYFEILKTK